MAFLSFVVLIISRMSVAKEIKSFVANSLAENNKQLFSQIKDLVSGSLENLKHLNSEAAMDQLREIKKFTREDPKSFNQKGNEFQYKFNAKVLNCFDDCKSHLESNAVGKAKESISDGMSMLGERQKLILLADKSEFGWKTVTEYLQHKLADDEQDGKKIRCAEERSEKAVKMSISKRSKSKSFVNRSFSSSRSLVAFSRAQPNSSNWERWRSYPPSSSRSTDGFPKPGSCFASGNFGHWRAQCKLVTKANKDGR